MEGYFRFYPGVDALATNGLQGMVASSKSGRTTSGRPTAYNISAPSGAPNPGAGGANSSSPSGNSSASTLYVRREAVYFGSDQVGIVRIGQDDGPFSQFDNGVTTFQFGDGAWNGDAPRYHRRAAASWCSRSGRASALNTSIRRSPTSSPRFAGFDLGVSFAPSNTAKSNRRLAAWRLSPGALRSRQRPREPSAAKTVRPTGYEVMGRYQGQLPGAWVFTASWVTPDRATCISGAPRAEGLGVESTTTAYNGFSVGDGGLALTYAGFTIGGNVLWGAF